MNEFSAPPVAIRPMTRADVDTFAQWGRHEDPLFTAFNIPPLDPGAADELWRHLAGRPHERRPYAGTVSGRFAAQLILRYGSERALGDIGIAVDPAIVGRGIGTRILRAFVRYLKEHESFERLSLDVAAYNERAIRAYHAAGFRQTGERWGDAGPGLDLQVLTRREGDRLRPFVRQEGETWSLSILHMEMRLDAETLT